MPESPIDNRRERGFQTAESGVTTGDDQYVLEGVSEVLAAGPVDEPTRTRLLDLLDRRFSAE